MTTIRKANRAMDESRLSRSTAALSSPHTSQLTTPRHGHRGHRPIQPPHPHTMTTRHGPDVTNDGPRPDVTDMGPSEVGPTETGPLLKRPTELMATKVYGAATSGEVTSTASSPTRSDTPTPLGKTIHGPWPTEGATDLTDLTETGPLLKSPPELMAMNRPGLRVAASTAWSPTCSDKPSATSNAFLLTTTADATVHTRWEDIAFGEEDTRKGKDFSSGGGR